GTRQENLRKCRPDERIRPYSYEHSCASSRALRSLTRSADQAECARKILTSRSATVCSSPGCNMNEFIASPGRPSPPPITIDGFEFRSICETCFGSIDTFESHVICIWGT